jgi:hypothetical protein
MNPPTTFADDPGAYQTLADLNAEDLFAKK